MSSLTLLGDTSGSVILQAPAVAGSGTVTLPTTGGTIRTTTTPGTILQVVNGNSPTTYDGTSSSSYVASSLYVTITPSSTSSKILILSNFNVDTVSNTNYQTKIYRNSTPLDNGRGGTYDGGWYMNPISTRFLITAQMQHYDSPSSTSALTYRIYFASPNSTSIQIRHDLSTSQILAMEIAG